MGNGAHDSSIRPWVCSSRLIPLCSRIVEAVTPQFRFTLLSQSSCFNKWTDFWTDFWTDLWS